MRPDYRSSFSTDLSKGPLVGCTGSFESVTLLFLFQNFLHFCWQLFVDVPEHSTAGILDLELITQPPPEPNCLRIGHSSEDFQRELLRSQQKVQTYYSSKTFLISWGNFSSALPSVPSPLASARVSVASVISS